MRISDWSSDVCSSDLGWEGDRIDVTGGSEVDAAAIFLPVAITCRLRAIAATDFRRPWLATRRRRFGTGRLRSLCRGRLAYDVGVMHNVERVVRREAQRGR